MSDTTHNTNEAVSNAKLIGLAVWSWLAAHPVILTSLAFVLGFMIG